MKHTIVQLPLVVVLASIFVLHAVPTAHAQEECSSASLLGSFGVTSSGTIVGVGALGAVGVVTFDGQGNHIGFDTISLDGSIIPKLTFTGTYSVNSDCTGSDTENFQNGLTIHRNFVIVDAGGEIRFIVTNPGNAVTAFARKIGLGEGACSVSRLDGSFGITTTGSIVAFGPVGPVAEVGVIKFDGAGSVSQTTTLSLNGNILPNRSSISGSYQVNRDCTGDLSLVLPVPGGTITSSSNFVIVDHGKEIRLVNTGAGRVLLGNARKE